VDEIMGMSRSIWNSEISIQKSGGAGRRALRFI
jgi:hypothetical protein